MSCTKIEVCNASFMIYKSSFTMGNSSFDYQYMYSHSCHNCSTSLSRISLSLLTFLISTSSCIRTLFSSSTFSRKFPINFSTYCFIISLKSVKWALNLSSSSCQKTSRCLGKSELRFSLTWSSMYLSLSSMSSSSLCSRLQDDDDYDDSASSRIWLFYSLCAFFTTISISLALSSRIKECFLNEVVSQVGLVF
jgi:hypothetical protein